MECAQDFVQAVQEIVANAVEHGGGHGWVRLWMSGGELVCEVGDEGHGVHDLTTGTRAPARSDRRGRGLWLARQLCLRVHGHNRHGCGHHGVAARECLPRS